jgi:hypothetical protein
MNKAQKFVPISAEKRDKNPQSYELLKEHLPLITCDCGAQILLLPDLHAMNVAIKAHVTEHRKKEKNPHGNVNASGNISRLLSQLTLLKMSEINGT